MNFSDADKRLCADHPSANVFPRTAVGKLRGLSLTDARAMHASTKSMATILSGSENKVKLSSAFSRIEQNSIWKHLWTTIC